MRERAGKMRQNDQVGFTSLVYVGKVNVVYCIRKTIHTSQNMHKKSFTKFNIYS